MANIKLTGNTWDTSSVYDDAQGKTQKQINAKAATNDGYFEDMTVGTAEQLLSSKYTEDKVPYAFRKTGGDNTVGKREMDKLVGGSIVWNQLCKDGNFQGNNTWAARQSSITISNGVATVTPNSDGTMRGITGTSYQNVVSYTGHIYLIECDVLSPITSTVSMSFGGGAGGIRSASCTADTWVRAREIWKPVSDSNTGLYVLVSGTTTTSQTIKFKNAVAYDLTAMFGAAIADHIYALETEIENAGILWFDVLFPKSYYAYNAGSLQSVNTSAHVTTGFNQWDEQWEVGTLKDSDGSYIAYDGAIRSKNYIPVIPGQSYYFIAPAGGDWAGGNCKIYWYGKNKEYGGVTGGRNGTVNLIGDKIHYIKFVLTGINTYNGGCCLNFSDPAKNGTYEPYNGHTYPLDSSLTLRGIPKLDSNNKLYYDGDTYESNGMVTRRYGIIDMGTIAWEKGSLNNAGTGYSYYKNRTHIPGSKTSSPNAVCSKFVRANRQSWEDMAVGEFVAPNSYFAFCSAATTAADFKASVSGVYLVYELATPTTESASPYTNPQICNPNGTEEYVDAEVLAEERDVSIPVGHETKYGEDLVGKLEDLPPIPNAPTTNGTYNLRVVVSGGEPTYSWVSV